MGERRDRVVRVRVTAAEDERLKAEASRRSSAGRRVTVADLFREQMAPLLGGSRVESAPPGGEARPGPCAGPVEVVRSPEVVSRPGVPSVADLVERAAMTADVAKRVLKWGGAQWDGDVLVVNGRRY